MLSTLHTLPGYPVNEETRSSSAKKAKGPGEPALSLTFDYFFLIYIDLFYPKKFFFSKHFDFREIFEYHVLRTHIKFLIYFGI